MVQSSLVTLIYCRFKKVEVSKKNFLLFLSMVEKKKFCHLRDSESLSVCKPALPSTWSECFSRIGEQPSTTTTNNFRKQKKKKKQ